MAPRILLPKPPSPFEVLRPILDRVELHLDVERDEDPEPWDTELWGPKGNMKCWQSTFTARAIVGGEELEAVDYLGGTWEISEQKVRDNNVSGYLTDQFIAQLTDLRNQVYDKPEVKDTHPIFAEIQIAIGKLTVLRDQEQAYNKQCHELDSEAWRMFQNDVKLYGLLVRAIDPGNLWKQVREAKATLGDGLPINRQMTRYAYFTHQNG